VSTINPYSNSWTDPNSWSEDYEFAHEWMIHDSFTNCTHLWVEKELLVHTFFECSNCKQTKTLEEMTKSDTIVKRISELSLPNCK